MFIFKALVAFIIALGFAYAVPQMQANATEAETQKSLAQLAQLQEMALVGDGTYPEQLSSLQNNVCAEDTAGVFGEDCEDSVSGLLDASAPSGITISYTLNAERTHYVVAAQLDGGRLLVRSDTVSMIITCETYNYDCLAQLTDDDDLRNSTPIWQTI